jgi:SPP1 gp7 family putative phage head morphogenesis protein
MSVRTGDKDRPFRYRGHEWANARLAANAFGVALRKIARHVGDLVRAFDPVDDPAQEPQVRHALERYADLITPWARAQAEAMLHDVSRRNEKAWWELARAMSSALRKEIREAPTGQVMRQLMDEQVTLIRSIPLKAARRVHELTLKGIEDSTRASEIAREIQRSGEVAASRATLIARTEVGRTAAALTQARAEYVGSEGYIWLSARDQQVRPSHRAMEGKFVRFDSPPTLDGMIGHAGALVNCRCVMLPVVPEKFD